MKKQIIFFFLLAFSLNIAYANLICTNYEDISIIACHYPNDYESLNGLGDY